MTKRGKIIGAGKFVVRNKSVNKVGLDSGVLIALIDNELLCLNKPKMFVKAGVCFACQLVVNQTIGVLINKRNYTREEAISQTLNYLKENNIKIIREEDIEKEKKELIYNDLKKQKK